MQSHHRPFIVGINGIDSSGKTTFSKCLCQLIEADNVACTLIHGDDFHNEKVIRYQNENCVIGYMNDSFNYNRLRRDVLDPILHGSFPSVIRLTVLDLDIDSYCKQVEYRVENRSIVLIEGVLLFSEQLNPYFDYKIFMQTSFEVAVQRAIERDIHIPKDEIPHRYASKYHAAQKIYLETCRPMEYANAIIDNSGNEPTIALIRG